MRLWQALGYLLRSLFVVNLIGTIIQFIKRYWIVCLLLLFGFKSLHFKKDTSSVVTTASNEIAPSVGYNAKGGANMKIAPPPTAQMSVGDEAPGNSTFSAFGAAGGALVGAVNNSVGEVALELLTPSANAQEVNANKDSMLIRNGQFTAYVNSIKTAKKSLTDIIQKHGARIDSENQYDQYDGINLNLTIKVPAAKFQTLFEELLQLSEKVQNQSVNVQDVTKQYVDVKARLENKHQLQKRFRDLVGKADKIKDILEIERELARVSEDIDSTTQVLKQLESDVAQSTINITLTEPKENKTPGPAPIGFIKKVISALGEGWTACVDSLLYMISLWPTFLLVFAAYLVWRYKRKKRSDY